MQNEGRSNFQVALKVRPRRGAPSYQSHMEGAIMPHYREEIRNYDCKRQIREKNYTERGRYVEDRTTNPSPD